MGPKYLPSIFQSLVNNGIVEEMPVALIERRTTKEQRVLLASLGSMEAGLTEESVVSPSLLIVGDMARLSSKLKWFGEQNDK